MDKIADSVLQEALDRLRRGGEGLGKCLVELGWPDEDTALGALAETLGIRFVELPETEVDRSAAAGIPPELIHKARIIPVSQNGAHLVLAMENPLDFQTADHIGILLGKDVERVICRSGDMAAAMQRFYGFSVERMIKHLETPDKEDATDKVHIGHLREIASEPTVVNLVNLMIARAIRDRASDIHIEPFENSLTVKYRIDGILNTMPSPPRHLHEAIVSRIKIMAEMNIAERYVPQDGHIELNFEGREVDVRVSTVPTLFGESTVMRLLDKASFLFGLDNVGFEETTLQRYRRVLNNPHGIVLVCGPTGSGKTTMLYASLNAIYSPERKVITIEDPVEYQLDGINQIPVRPKRGLSFANGLRAIVRQDPDVIMVGEIRDNETAEIAIRSALTGHLVLSSLHTNDAPESIARLLDMGVAPYLIASAVRGILAQRLVRKVCHACAEPVEADGPTRTQIRQELGGEVPLNLRRGRGCSECNHTGYRGRMAIIELMLLDDALRELVLQHASAAAIRHEAVQKMQTMRQSGWTKVAQGLTTPEEVIRATQIETYADGLA